MTKTFRIGEYAIGGIIRVSVGDKVLIQALDWDTKKVVAKKEFPTATVTRGEIDEYLNELTSSYHAEKILDWIFAK